MRTFDHLILAMGIHLVRIHERDSVVILTGDNRIADIARRSQTIPAASAKKLGLTVTARWLGLTWTPDIYPKVLNLGKSKKTEMLNTLGMDLD